MIDYDYRCPTCGKYREFDPACYEVGDVVYVCYCHKVTTERGISERTVGYYGRIEELNRPVQALVRRGVKGYGKCHVEDIADMIPINLPEEVAIGDNLCTCNNSQSPHPLPSDRSPYCPSWPARPTSASSPRAAPCRL